MCGIVGLFEPKTNRDEEDFGRLLSEMTDTMHRRGPDGSGTFVDHHAGIGFGHRRLSILDLSPSGAQPMTSADGRWVITFNGEIYNHLELRDRLNQPFRGHSDTETLVEAVAAWGVERTLPQLNGMFAFAVWDKQRRELTLARDRVGIKPLYYGQLPSPSAAGTSWAFASELKPLRCAFRNELRVDPQAVALLLRHSYIPAPWSIYRDIKKLLAGTFLVVREAGGGLQVSSPQVYWSLEEIIERGRRNRFGGTFEEAVDACEDLLKRSVQRRRLADVPLGAFLSGGIDSSLVVAIMQSLSNRPSQTFSIGFEERGYNEAPYAKAVAEHLGTEHTELIVTPREAREVIPQLPALFDEPFADSSQIPMFLVSQLARRRVTVALSGDGGDELFGGYQRYTDYERYWNKLNAIPLRGGLSAAMHLFAACLPGEFQRAKWKRRAKSLHCDSADELYAKLHRHWTVETVLSGDVLDPSHDVGFGVTRMPNLEPRLRWMALDLGTYLPDDILTKVDRASMAVGLEARVPLLDHEVVEFAWSLPTDYRYTRENSKRLLKSLLSSYVPAALFERPKVGFGVPIGDWLRGPLRDWAEDLLSESSLDELGFLNVPAIRDHWRQHVSGEVNWQYLLWDVLMLQAWLGEFDSIDRKIYFLAGKDLR